MSCPHGVWHAVDCEQCSAEAALWQRLAEANAVADAAMKEALARITRLEADNAEAREFAAQVIEDALYRDSSGTRTRDGSMYCQHCNERNEEKTQHAENCMVNRAKAFLAKQGDTQ